MKKIILAILVSGLALFTNQSSNLNNINTCFKESGAEFIKESVFGWSEIKTSDSPQAAAERICNSMNLQNALNIGWKDRMYCITAENNGIVAVVKTTNVDNLGSIYACVEYSQYHNIMNINNMKRNIEDAFCSYDARVFYSVLVQGRYNKNMTLKEMSERTDFLLKASDASYIDGMADGSLVSICAFSQQLPSCESRTVNGKNINLNVALRTSKTDSCTYIWIGYPIITIEYSF